VRCKRANCLKVIRERTKVGPWVLKTGERNNMVMFGFIGQAIFCTEIVGETFLKRGKSMVFERGNCI